jgi:hypothetical protein
MQEAYRHFAIEKATLSLKVTLIQPLAGLQAIVAHVVEHFAYDSKLAAKTKFQPVPLRFAVT